MTVHVILKKGDYKARKKDIKLRANVKVWNVETVLDRVREDMPRRPSLDKLRDMADKAMFAQDIRLYALALVYLEGGVVVAMGRVSRAALDDIDDMLSQVEQLPAHPVFAMSADMRYAVAMAPQRSDPRVVAEIMALKSLDGLYINIDTEAAVITEVDQQSMLGWILGYLFIFLGTIVAAWRMWRIRAKMQVE